MGSCVQRLLDLMRRWTSDCKSVEELVNCWLLIDS